MSNVTIFDATKFGQVPANVRAAMGTGRSDELAGGITGGFAVVSIRGKAFRVKSHGEERMLMDETGQRPRMDMEVVIVKAAANLSKIWYERGYTEGSNAAPDCWSVNGVVPDPASPKRQSTQCGGCPHNAWGSRISNDGKGKGKACQDSKRLALVPAQDINNDVYGGPMLMRIPPASLADLKKHSDVLNQIGFPYYAVVTRITFDFTTEYPAVKFSAIRPLTEDEAAKVLSMREGPAVERILNTAIEEVHTDGSDTTVPTASSVFEQPPAAQAALLPAKVTAPIKFFPEPDVAPVPATPSPVQASQARAEEVDAKVEGDPKADQRAKMRSIGMTESQIEAVLGPEPKAEVVEPEPVDPNAEQRAKMRSIGMTEEQINAALGQAPVKTRKPRGPNKPKEVQPLVAPTPAPVSEPKEAKAEATKVAVANGAHEEDDDKGQPNGAVPGAIGDEFENMLDNLLGPSGGVAAS